MEITLTLIAVVGTLIGAFGGAYLNHWLESQRNMRHVLFDSRREIYSKLVGISRSMILNLFNKDELKEFQRVASHCLLLSSDDVRDSIVSFVNLLDRAKVQQPLSSDYEIVSPKDLIKELKKLELKLKKDLDIT